MGGAKVYDCVIVGGGMVGATLAAALAQGGLSLALVDRAPAEARLDAGYDGRASTIAYGSQRMLAALGLWPAMAPEAAPILDIRISDTDAPLFLHYDHREVGSEPMGWVIENRAIRRALFGALGGVAAIHAPAVVESFAVGPGKVSVALKGGDSLEARLLVAADGADSALRGMAGIALTAWRYRQTAIVCTMGHELPHEGVAHERFLPAGPFAVLPMTDHPEHGHRSSIVWTEREDAAPAFLALDDAAFGRELQTRFGDWLGACRVVGGRWSYGLRLLHAETYVRPRFALIGDAAHTIHPIAGQGLNLGLRDVAALAEALVDAHRLGLDPGSLAVLEAYQRRRRFDTVALMTVTDGLNRLFSNAVEPVRLARDLGLAAVGRLPALKRFFMRHAMGTVGDLPRLLRGEAL
jgi:2-octaprenyl-6-methoxyphenol hydroxylase